MYQYYNSGAKTKSKKLSNKSFSLLGKRFKSFGYFIKVDFNLNVYLNHGISINVIKGEMYTKGFTYFDLGVSASLGPDFVVISFGGEVTGHIAEGNAYIQANTLLNVKSKSMSKKAYFVYYKNLYSCRVDLEVYFSIWLIFWKKTFKDRFNIFKGLASYEHFYEYV